MRSGLTSPTQARCLFVLGVRYIIVVSLHGLEKGFHATTGVETEFPAVPEEQLVDQDGP
jgi:hypothetical protein